MKNIVKLITVEPDVTAEPDEQPEADAGDGSIVARSRYTIESAEGFGSRFDQMMNTLTVIGR